MCVACRADTQEATVPPPKVETAVLNDAFFQKWKVSGWKSGIFLCGNLFEEWNILVWKPWPKKCLELFLFFWAQNNLKMESLCELPHRNFPQRTVGECSFGFVFGGFRRPRRRPELSWHLGGFIAQRRPPDPSRYVPHMGSHLAQIWSRHGVHQL